jgi:hypothetical protein
VFFLFETLLWATVAGRMAVSETAILKMRFYLESRAAENKSARSLP